MNLNELQRRLIAAARAHPPSAQVPYAFEQRILARLKERPLLDAWSLWARALWQAAAPCVALTILLSAWSALTPGNTPAGSDLSQDLERTVLAAADADATTDSVW